MTVLVTGGAGYIGAHVVQQARDSGLDVVVVDDLSTGVAHRVEGVALHRVDVAEPGAVEALGELMEAARVDAVVHLAARKRVDESVARPACSSRLASARPRSKWRRCAPTRADARRF